MGNAYDAAPGWDLTSMPRRTFGKLALTGAAAAGYSLTLGRHATATGGAITGVDLTGFPVPFFSSFDGVMTQDADLLNTYAVQYGQMMADLSLPPSSADFWFRYLPIPLFNSAIHGDTLGDNDGVIKRHLWMMHLVGYFGGVWFGKKLDELTCDPGASPPADCNNPPAAATDADFAGLVKYLDGALTAAYAGDDQVPIDQAEFYLRGDPSDPDMVLQALITLYGYNVGYTQAILDPVHRPNPATDCSDHRDTPAQWDPPQNSQIENYHQVFGAEFPQFARAPYDPAPFPPPVGSEFEPVPFLTGDTAGLAQARELHAAAVDLTPGSNYFRILNGAPNVARGKVPLPAAVRALFDQAGAPVPADMFLMGGNLIAQQTAASRVGFSTWSIPFFLDVRGWDRVSYREIIGLSVYFVQAVQLAGLACLSSAAEADPNSNRARDAVLTAALVQPFGGSYLVGLNDGDNADYCTRTAAESLPPFTYT